MTTRVVPPCPIDQCVVFPDMVVLPDNPIVQSPLSSETERYDWTGELTLQPCGHTLTDEQRDAWLTACYGSGD
jgi:hypothetical protein